MAVSYLVLLLARAHCSVGGGCTSKLLHSLEGVRVGSDPLTPPNSYVTPAPLIMVMSSRRALVEAWRPSIRHLAYPPSVSCHQLVV